MVDDAHWRPERLLSFGRAVRSQAHVARPRDADALRACFTAPADGRGFALRGSGCSYGDASFNSGGRIIALDAMNRVLDWDAASGVAQLEPGVTIEQLCQLGITDGWWPAVVPGTMKVSIGGAAAMNIHGKNNYAVGSFGEHVRSFRLMTPNGEIIECSRSSNPELFHAAIGGFGMLGCFVEIVVQLKRVHSGRLRVWAIPVSSLAENLARFKELTPVSDYLVGWMDLYARGTAAGRGLMHRAQHLGEGEDPEDFLTPEKQQLPSRLFGVVPKGWIWPGMWGAAKLGLGPVVNAAKFRAGFHEARSSPFLQPHGGFHFLFDYVPHWHWAWRPGGFIQFQPFIPADAAASTLREIIDRCQSAGFVSHLGVLKQHRVDPFLMTHAVDGFSLALDFAVPSSRAGRERLWQHTHDLADAVLDVGGRFYYAKDATLLESSFERIHGRDAVARFRDLKQQVDPEDLLQTDLSRRLFQGRHPA